MPSARQVASALYGAWRLMRFDAGGMAWFEVSIAGFWRSFFAAVIVAPGVAILVALNLADRSEPFDAGWAIVVWAVTYAIMWAAFPIVAILITHLLGLGGRYVPLIVAYNWASVPQVLVDLSAALIGSSGLGPTTVGKLVVLAAFIYLRVYQWFVIRTALETAPLTAAAIVVLDFLIGALIFVTAAGLI